MAAEMMRATATRRTLKERERVKKTTTKKWKGKKETKMKTS